MPHKVIVMIGPSCASQGGMASVVNSFRAAGLFERWPIVYLHTHIEGGKLAKLRVAIVAWLQFAGLLARGRVALLHAHVPRRNAFWRKTLFILPARLARCPYIVHLHSGGFVHFYQHEIGPLRRRLVRFVLDHAARIVVLSSQWQQALAGITRNPHLVTVYNFVTTQAVNLRSEQQPNTLLFLGRLNEEKGYFDLLHAVKLLRADFPDVLLYCGGVGDDAEIQRSLRDLNLEQHVRLLGWVEGEVKQRLFAHAAVFVLPSYVEGMPMGILEAMAQGGAVVATSAGGIPDMIDAGVEGLLVTPGDIPALTYSLAKLLRNSVLRARMGEAGRQRVARQFSAVAVLPVLDKMYRELTSDASDAARDELSYSCDRLRAESIEIREREII